jgi:hypothetical protein
MKGVRFSWIIFFALAATLGWRVARPISRFLSPMRDKGCPTPLRSKGWDRKRGTFRLSSVFLLLIQRAGPRCSVRATALMTVPATN